MEQNERILSLCESCIKTLRSVLNADLPMNINMALTQKLFLLETGLEELQSASAPNSSQTNASDGRHMVASKDMSSPYSYYTDKYTSLKDAVKEFEKDIIVDAIQEHGSKRKAAVALGMDHSTLIKKCQRYGI